MVQHNTPVPPTSSLAQTNERSTLLWQQDLKTLFDSAKEKFPDVVWELGPDFEHSAEEEVWGHKAIVYARAPPSFLAQYFDVRPNGSSRIFSGSSTLAGENPTQSTFSLSLADGRFAESPDGGAVQPRSPSPTASNTLQPLRLTSDVPSALFSNQLEYLYTGSGLGDAFDFLFDAPDEDQTIEDVEAHRVDKLRKDLVFMWRSRLYSDVRIELSGPFAPNSEEATAVFSSHRFILASRSPYFRSLFLGKGFAPVQGTNPSSPITISLPSPPFTPASLHFTLGYIYSGTLFFSNRTFDLTTSFQIYRSAIYLSLTALQAEIEARIIEEMLHGLFHAYLTFENYEKVTGGRWGVGGCKCKTCVRRIPRVLEFAIADDVKNNILERGARRGLVGIFGEGWVTPEFNSLPAAMRALSLRGVQARTTLQNVFPLLFAAEAALAKLDTPGVQEQPWAETVRELVLTARKKMDELICSSAEEAFEQEEWLAILERGGAGFNDTDQVKWVMDAIRRGLSESTAGTVYQTLVSSVLLRTQTNPADGSATPVLPATSSIRSEIERARLDVIRWLRKRWVGVRMANGFEPLEGWALKEISDELEVPVEDLLSPAPQAHSTPKKTTIRSDRASTLKSVRDPDTISISPSLRSNILTRNAAQSGPPDPDEPRPKESLGSSRSSIASSITSVRTTTRGSATSTTPLKSPAASSSVSTSARRTPASSSNKISTSSSGAGPSMSGSSESAARSKAGNGVNGTPTSRPRSLAPSIASSVRSSVSSVRSTASNSTLRKSHLAPPTPTGTGSNPSSPLSEVSTTYQTASPGGALSPRMRTTSALSNVSSTSFKSGSRPSFGGNAPLVPTLTVPVPERQRRTSTSSATSTKSTASRASALSKSVGSKPAPSPSKAEGSSRPLSTASTNGKKLVPKNKAHTAAPPVPPVPASVRDSKTPAGRVKAEELSRKSTSSIASKSSSVATNDEVMAELAAAAAVTTAAVEALLQSESLSKPSTPSVASASTAVPPFGHASQPSDGSIATIRRAPAGLKRTPSTDTITKSASVVSDGAGTGTSTSTPRQSQLFTPRESMAPSDGVASPVEKALRRPSSPLKKSALAIADTNIAEALDIAAPLKSALGAVQQGESSQGLPSKTSKASLKPSIKSSSKRASAAQKHASIQAVVNASDNQTLPPPSLNGVTLQIGIPCLISLKRTRFKAFARYIGEVAGKDGPWIGVEVPVPVASSSEKNKLGEREWNDGSIAGVRYFEIGSNSNGVNGIGGAGGSGSGQTSGVNSMVLEEDEERAARRRRIEAIVLGASSHGQTPSSLGLHSSLMGAMNPGSIPGSGSGSGAGSGPGSVSGNPAASGTLGRHGVGAYDTMSIASMSSQGGMSAVGAALARRKREGESLIEQQERLKRLRSVSPVGSVSEAGSGTGAAMFETRGLFVRPKQVLLVMDAPEHR